MFSLIGVISGFILSNQSLRTFFENKIVIEFCFGMALATMYAKGFRISKRASMLMIFLGVSALLAASDIGIAADYRWLILGVPSAAVLWGTLNSHSNTLNGNWRRRLLFMGDASYSTYLVHGFITLTIARLAEHLPFTYLITCLLFFVSVAASLAAGILIYITVEKPITKWLKDSYSRVRLRPRPRSLVSY